MDCAISVLNIFWLSPVFRFLDRFANVHPSGYAPVMSSKKLRRKKTDWRKEWRAQCRRQLERDSRTRMLCGFVRTYKPVLDDAPYRIFDSMKDYRKWCEKALPRYLGYFQWRRSGSVQKK